MKIISTAFENNQLIPKTYTCDGDNINPDLEISDVPANTASLALIMDDPDAPSGTFTHWMLWNIPATVRIIEKNSIPEGAIQGLNSANKVGFIAPCPPHGTHRYYFKLYALNKKINVGLEISREELESLINDFLIEKAEYVGIYTRN